MGKKRMYEAYGFMETEGYVSLRNVIDDEIATNRSVDNEQTKESFAKVEFNSDTSTIVFRNAINEAIGSLDVKEMFPSYLVEDAYYDKDTQILTIKFDSDHEVEIDMNDLITVDEAGDGLVLSDGKFSVKVADDSEEFLQVTSGGVKTVGIQDAINVERDRAISAETQEINDRIADVDEEEARAKAAEADLLSLLNAETSNRVQDVDIEEARAISAETALDAKIEAEISARTEAVADETSRAEAEEFALDDKIEAEINNRIVADLSEKNRAEAEETRLGNVIGNGFSTASTETVTFKFNTLSQNLTNEITNRTTQDNQLQNAITNETIAREGADTILQNNINAENARAVGVENGLRSDLNGEVARAVAEDERLAALISGETEARVAEDAELNDKISGEKSRAENAESLLQQSIDHNHSLIEGLESSKADKDSVYTKSETDSAITSAISSVVDGAPETFDTLKEISDYISSDMANAATMIADISTNKADIAALKAKDVELQGEIDLKASEANLEALEGIVSAHTSDTVSHVTQSDKDNWNNKIDITALSGYATEQWVEDKHYLTEHQDLSEYATLVQVDEKDDDIRASIPTVPTNVSAFVNDVPYLTEHQDLSEYATKAEIPTDFYTQEQVNVMMSQLLTRIENLEEQNGVIVADTAEAVQHATEGSNMVLTSTDAIQSMTSNTKFNTITIVGGNSNSDIKAIADDKLTVDGMSVNGDKGASNGRMVISANTVNIKNVTVESGSTAYNIFESSQNTTKPEYFTKEYTVSNLTVDNTELNHNVLNIYTFEDDAVVTVKDSYFNLDADKSNVLRLANYNNATGVTINFENVDWTYENATASDWAWAGLVIYQPSSSDLALNGDTSKLATWKFNFIDCRYNGEVVDDVNFGGHNQVVYGYDINRSGNVSDISSISTFNFS